jgi:hypothetical protein
MLRTYRSFKAYSATLWWRWSVFFFPLFQVMEHHWNEIDRGKTEVLGEEPVPVPLCPPQIPHGLTRDRTRTFAVGDRRLTAWAMARPNSALTYNSSHCNHVSRAMTQAGNRRPLTYEAWVRSQAIRWGICAGTISTMTGFTPSALVSPTGIIPPMIHTHFTHYHRRYIISVIDSFIKR